MRAFISQLALGTLAVAVLLADAPRRQSVPIGGEWNLSALSVERTKMDGKRVVQIVAKGEAQLKKGRNQFLGPWVLEASASEIQCDFPEKRFLLRGPFEIERRPGPEGGTLKYSGGADSTAEVSFENDHIRIDEPHQSKAEVSGAEKK